MNRVKHTLLFVFLVPSILAAESLVILSHPRKTDTRDTRMEHRRTPEVFACLQISASLKGNTLMEGEFIASEIFRRISVPLRWSCDHSPSPGDPHQTVIIRLTDRAPHNLPENALASALPFAREGVRVTVFQDRFETVVENQRSFEGIVFGHILAHEIAHVLARVDTHAKSGLMRALWTPGDFSSMRDHLLGFTPEDAQFIRSALQSRP